MPDCSDLACVSHVAGALLVGWVLVHGRVVFSLVSLCFVAGCAAGWPGLVGWAVGAVVPLLLPWLVGFLGFPRWVGWRLGFCSFLGRSCAGLVAGFAAPLVEYAPRRWRYPG